MSGSGGSTLSLLPRFSLPLSCARRSLRLARASELVRSVRRPTAREVRLSGSICSLFGCSGAVVKAVAREWSAFRVGTGSIFSHRSGSFIVVVWRGCPVGFYSGCGGLCCARFWKSIFFRVLDAGPVSVSERTAPLLGC